MSTRKDGTFSRADFTFDKDRNVYICPMGKLLKTTGRILAEHKYRYIASTCDCGPCPLKSKCCPNTPARMIPRDINEDARDVARALTGTKAFDQSRRRGPRGAQDEFTLAAIAQNLCRLAKLVARAP